MPASLILLACSQSYKTMRNKSALSKNREEVWKSMALPNNVLDHHTLRQKAPEIGFFFENKGSSTIQRELLKLDVS